MGQTYHPCCGQNMATKVTFNTDSERVARAGNSDVIIPTATELSGDLALERSDGPFGVKEYENPSFLLASFQFPFNGSTYKYSGFITAQQLWAPNGTSTLNEPAEFQSCCGTIDGMMDGRDDWFYLRPDGSNHSNRLKYTSCHFDVSPQDEGLVVKCKYYDQNEAVADYLTIYYSRPYCELLLLEDHKYFHDSSGNLEDVDWNAAGHVKLEPVP